MSAISRGYVAVSFGQVHYAECGDGDPIILLHQTPRSWDEYREVLPLLGQSHRAIAFDTAGYGSSDVPPGVVRVEVFANGVAEALGGLGISGAVVVGHHTGGVIAIDLATRHPDLIGALVLSSTPYIDSSVRQRRREHPPIDEVERTDDGSYLMTLWNRRSGFYPDNDPQLLERFVTDALRAGDRADEGHRVVSRYHMEDRISLVRQPVLLIGAAKDPFAYPDFAVLAEHFPDAPKAVIEEGMVPLMERHADEVVGHILSFVETLGS